MARGQIVYGTKLLTAATLGERVARTIQSQAASALADSLAQPGFAPTKRSKSHSRSIVAAALANADVTALGIDVEWMALDRPFAAILQSFAPSLHGTIDAETFYRGWTFLEAYFKAFQRWPAEAEIAEVVQREACEPSWRTATGTELLQHTVYGGFQLTVVWQCAADCAIRRTGENQA